MPTSRFWPVSGSATVTTCPIAAAANSRRDGRDSGTSGGTADGLAARVRDHPSFLCSIDRVRPGGSFRRTSVACGSNCAVAPASIGSSPNAVRSSGRRASNTSQASPPWGNDAAATVAPNGSSAALPVSPGGSGVRIAASDIGSAASGGAAGAAGTVAAGLGPAGPASRTTGTTGAGTATAPGVTTLGSPTGGASTCAAVDGTGSGVAAWVGSAGAATPGFPGASDGLAGSAAGRTAAAARAAGLADGAGLAPAGSSTSTTTRLPRRMVRNVVPGATVTVAVAAPPATLAMLRVPPAGGTCPAPAKDSTTASPSRCSLNGVGAANSNTTRPNPSCVPSRTPAGSAANTGPAANNRAMRRTRLNRSLPAGRRSPPVPSRARSVAGRSANPPDQTRRSPRMARSRTRAACRRHAPRSP